MNLIEWRRIKKMENENSFHTELKVGDKFLYGNQQIAQVEKKKAGDRINFFTVLRIEGKNCEYVLSFDEIEDKIKEEKNDYFRKS
jgi:hypothetical protein